MRQKGMIGAVFFLLLTVLLLGNSWATEACISCHKTVTPGIVSDYQHSAMAEEVGCLDCHEGTEDDPAIREHNGFEITPLVTPKKCGECHPKELKQFRNSMHDEAGLFSLSAYATENGKVRNRLETGKNKNYKTHFSRESAEGGCLDCHGTVIKVGEDKELINWPNNGMGRFNPDGSVGSCATCHPRHRFSVEMARKPEVCGQCHLGPDHPQREIYEESMHGNIFASLGEEMDWSGGEDRELGPDDVQAPTCAVCHMLDFGSGAGTTHDVSSRLKWELEPAFSWPTEPRYWSGEEKYPIDKEIAARYEEMYNLSSGALSEVGTGAPNPFGIAKSNAPEVYNKYVGEGKWWSEGDTRADAFRGESLDSPEEKRERMLKVCTQCHSRSWAEGDLNKADNVIEVYNAVALAIKKKYYDPIKENNLDVKSPLGKSEVDTLWHEIWHHEGRIWRMGAFMQGQDWEHWEGAYEVADDVNHMADWYAKLTTNRDVAELQDKVENLEAKEKKATTDTSGEEGGGICGPSALIAIALVPLAGYAALRRRRP